MPDDSRELLVRYQRGDPTAAEAIFARYANRLLALARSRLSPKLARRVDADDVVQSTYRSFFVRRARENLSPKAKATCGDCWRRSPCTSWDGKLNVTELRNDQFTEKAPGLRMPPIRWQIWSIENHRPPM